MNDADNLDQIQVVNGEINAILYPKELFWRQGSRNIWLPAGDKNTKYFHQKASQRRRKNHIAGFMDEGGQWCIIDEEKERVVEEYIQWLYTTTNPNEMRSILDKVDGLSLLIWTKLSSNHIHLMRSKEHSSKCTLQNHQALMVCLLFFSKISEYSRMRYYRSCIVRFAFGSFFCKKWITPTLSSYPT